MYKIVLEAISNAYENGYELDMTDEELAWELVYSGFFDTDVDIDEVIQVVKEIRNA
jgi:hypothetical protein